MTAGGTLLVAGHRRPRSLRPPVPASLPAARGCVCVAWQGLAFIHEHKLVHLDVKPGNIFVAKADDGVIPDALKSNRASWNDRAISEPVLSTASAAGAPASGAASPPRLVYKVGDLGHVTSMENPRLQDGDSRYMAPELLNDDTSDLPRADVFSLGLSLYELARHVPLPKNGDEWQDLRKGLAPALPGYSDEFNHWLQVRRGAGPPGRGERGDGVDTQRAVSCRVVSCRAGGCARPAPSSNCSPLGPQTARPRARSSSAPADRTSWPGCCVHSRRRRSSRRPCRRSSSKPRPRR